MSSRGSAGDEQDIPVVLMRGGTSKGVFVREADLPDPGPARDQFVLALLGSPDPMQIDGLGGTHSSTSKLMAVSASTRAGCDVDYLFAQVGIDRPVVDYAGNCGNLTAAVGAYAVDEGLVVAVEPITAVRLFNRNTGRRITAHVPVARGQARSDGDFALPGVPGTGAALLTEYLDPAGSVTGSILPTGRPVETIHPSVGGPVEVSIVDVTGPVVFAQAADLGLVPHADPAAINLDPATLARLESVRAACAVLLGFASDEDDAVAVSSALPRLVSVAAPQPHRLADGQLLEASTHDLLVRATSMQRAHHSCPLTSAMCTAAASRIVGTIPFRLTDRRSGTTVRVAHPKGVIELDVRSACADPTSVISVGVVRTARRLMAGTAYVRTGSRPCADTERH